MNMKTLTRVGMIAAIYTVVSLVLAPFTYGNVQVRIAEALTLLPLIYKPSIWGVTLGCFLTNLIGAMLGINPTGFFRCDHRNNRNIRCSLLHMGIKDKKVMVSQYLLA